METRTWLLILPVLLLGAGAHVEPRLLAPAAVAGLIVFGLLWFTAAPEPDRRLTLALALGLAAWWVGGRRPWEPWAGALIWAGAVLLATRPRPEADTALGALLLGLLSAAAVGALAAEGLPLSPVTGAFTVALLVLAGRLAAVALASSGSVGALPAAAWVLGAGLPLHGDLLLALALGVEGLVTWSVLAQGDRPAAWAWALGGIAAGAGVWGMGLL